MGESAKDGTQQFPSALPFWELMQESRMFRALVEKTNKYQIGPPKHHWKDFEM